MQYKLNVAIHDYYAGAVFDETRKRFQRKFYNVVNIDDNSSEERASGPTLMDDGKSRRLLHARQRKNSSFLLRWPMHLRQTSTS